MVPNALDIERLESFLDRDPRIGRVRTAAAGAPVFLVGGSVRDLLLGWDPVDVDLAIEGDATALARQLDPAAIVHDRFGTARLDLPEGSVDLASTRSEEYARPGSLPEVAPAGITADLGRRDFTINALATSLTGEDGLIDPHGGRVDLAEGRIEVLHPESLRDDPIRALRAARYVARFGFLPGPMLSDGIASLDLDSVSEERVIAEIRRFAAEPDPVAAVRTTIEMGIPVFSPGAPAALEIALSMLEEEPWKGFADPSLLLSLLAERTDPLDRIADIDPRDPESASRALARLEPEAILLARAAGEEWLDSWPGRWSSVSLEIDGEDLLAEGIRPGPAIGRGLRAAHRERLLAGHPIGRDAELAIALEAARKDPVD